MLINQFFILANNNNFLVNSHTLWILVVPLKVKLFAWRLLLSIPTKDNLVTRRVLQDNDQSWTGGFGMKQDIYHLFVRCDFFFTEFGHWPGFVTIHPGAITYHFNHFCCLGGYSKKARLALKVILFCCV